MASVQIQTKVNLKDLLDGVQKLDSTTLESFADQVMLLRAQRRSSSIPQKETDLLKRINVGLSAPMGARLAELRAKKESSSLTEDENSEYLQIAYQVEELDVQRLEALSELAQIRDVTVRELMTQLSL
ncbi:MAG: hypothetical protein ACI9EW_003105 [Cellvibrionaceae bacterium]|jgi:hypothetical protein